MELSFILSFFIKKVQFKVNGFMEIIRFQLLDFIKVVGQKVRKLLIKNLLEMGHRIFIIKMET